ncbi:SRPBCC family protein [Acidipila sp. EB88]|uniref:SRPBCC family protein n=1 Tax=Acidipila sp. EB88 TaxID=2305226 RepID=UPI000F601F5D|nr:SRPBCC family protein [Acidipila sp. EB88]RRA48864.1 cyclase [Acidipila sp. EB88]
MRHRLQMHQWVPYAVPAVFDFFANPANLPPLMPRWQAARIDTAELVDPVPAPADRPAAKTPAAGQGSRMLISFRLVPLLPIRMQWDARIVEFAWDDHFCDAQVTGPFAYWRHCHRLHAETRQGAEGTVVTDDVTYAFPLGPLGDLAWLAGGALQVQSLFRYRQRQLLKLLPAAR